MSKTTLAPVPSPFTPRAKPPKSATSVNPDMQVAIVYKDLQAVISDIPKAITSVSDMERATVTLSILNKCNDKVKKEKKVVLDPLEALIDIEEARWKDVQTLLKGHISALKTMVNEYQTEATNARLEAETKLAERIGEGKGKIKLETAVRKIDELETVEKKVETSAGSLTFKPHKMCEVINIKDLPIEYHLPDDVAIRKAMNEGIKLPGVRYWVEQRSTNRR